MSGLESAADFKEVQSWMYFGIRDLGYKAQIFEEACKKITDEDTAYACLATIRES